MKKTLYKHQKEACASALIALKEGHTPYLSVSTGGGKSLILAHLTDKAMNQGLRVLQLVPSKELVEQNAQESFEYVKTPSDIGICCSKLKKFQVHRKAVIATYTSFLRRRSTSGRFDVLLIDECFSGDTLIDTPQGLKRIDLVRCGDAVYNAIGVGIVEKTSIKPATETYILEFDDESRIECTGEHPFFTSKGWIKAKELEKGASFFSIKGMSYLWENIHSLDKGSGWEDSKLLLRAAMGEAKNLLRVLCEEITEPNEQSSITAKNDCKITGDKAQAYKTWRERAIAIFSSIGDTSCSWGRVGIGSISKDEQGSLKRYLSELLQDRYSKQGTNDRNRIGRRVTFVYRQENERFEKIRASCFPRLVNISVNKRESITPVFNLSISGHPSYFAGGKLVHNCHGVRYEPTSSYRKIITSLKRINPDIKIVGVTATPVRMLSGRLEEKYLDFDPIFTKCAYETSVQDLIKQGILSHVESISGDIQVDLSEVPLKGGDYDTEIASVRFDAILPHAIPDLKLKVAAYGIKTVLVFASNVANARKIISEWGDENIKLIYGEMSSVERVRIINWLKHGEGVRVVVNVNVLLVGFNFQKLDAVCFLRATKSLALYRQAVGRVLRSHEEKTIGYVIDYSGNIQEHGPIDCEIPVKARKRRGDQPRKICTAVNDGIICNEPNLLSAKKCSKCHAEFISVDESGRYLMRSKAQILAMKQEQSKITYAVDNCCFSKHTKEGRDMIKVEFFTKDYNDMDELICCDYIMLDSSGSAGGLAIAKIKRLMKSPRQDWRKIQQFENGANTKNVLFLLNEYYDTFFRKITGVVTVRNGRFVNCVEYITD
jgi:superfamily II DNA or RNA helicase